jgi:chemotaxis protein methyltransferase CheR
MTSRQAAPPFSERDYELVRALVRERSGVQLRDTRRGELDRAILDALRASGAGTAEELCRFISDAAGRSALDTLLGALTIRESHFFRTRAQFDALSDDVLPSLLEARRERRRLRVWSAGCAAGEEPYSVAILLERLLPEIEDWDVLVLATDISGSALQAARRGLYRRWSFREVPEEIERTYFIDQGEHLEVIPRIRDRVSFAPHNLVGDRYPSLLSNTVEMDLVLCRNVLIYFSEAVAGGVVARLGNALADGGWLVLAPAEVAIAHGAGLVSRRIGGTLMHQKVTKHKPRPVAHLPVGPRQAPGRRHRRVEP